MNFDKVLLIMSDKFKEIIIITNEKTNTFWGQLHLELV